MLTFILTTSIASAAPKDYAFLSNRGLLYVKVLKDETTAASGLSHNHAIQAVGWSGKATWDTENVETCSVSLAVPANSLYADRLEVRQKAGLSGSISDSQRKEITKNMLKKDQLWADQHPMITFKSSSCAGGPDQATINGKFTLRGVTRDIRVPVTVDSSAGLKLTGSFKVKATDYGFQPYSAMFGQLKNQNEMSIHLELVSN